MKLGQTLHGYTVVTRPSNTDAGKCLWAFAERDNQEFFIKEFLDPKIPKPDSMGSVADKQRRYAECERFRARHLRVMDMLRADEVHAGNLVLAVDFFAEGTRYYKVTPRVHTVDDSPCDLPPRAQLVLLRTLADSVRLLHGFGIVHGDLKPQNVLLTHARRGTLHVAKLIDFDDAFPAGDPPSPDVIGGNPLYGAPEWLRYVQADGPVVGTTLTQAADMFGFGLLIHTYLFGTLPYHGTEHESPAAAALDGVRIEWDPRTGGLLRVLLDQLTAVDPLARPGIDATVGLLSRPDILTAAAHVATATATATPPTDGGDTANSRVRFNFGDAPTARLRINMTRNT